MDTENKYKEEIQREHEFCISAGIKNKDMSRLQRKQFNERTASDIILCDSPPKNISREGENDIYLSNEVVTRCNDQKQSESRHFHLSSENGSMTRNYPDQDEDEQAAEPKESVGRDDCLSEGMDTQNKYEEEIQREHEFCMSAGIKNKDVSRLQRRHFNERTASDIIFCDSSPENISREGENDIYLSNEVVTRDNDQKQSESQHFQLCSENRSMTRNYPNQDEDQQAAEPKESAGRDDCLSKGMDKHNADPKLSTRRHYTNQDEDEQAAVPREWM